MLRRNSLLLSRSSASCQYLRDSEKGRAEEEQAGVREQVNEKLRGCVQLRRKKERNVHKEENVQLKRSEGKERKTDSISN